MKVSGPKARRQKNQPHLVMRISWLAYELFSHNTSYKYISIYLSIQKEKQNFIFSQNIILLNLNKKNPHILQHS